MSFRPRLLVLASGSATGGGSGFENLVNKYSTSNNPFRPEIVAVVSNHLNGGVRQKADRLKIPFIHCPSTPSAEQYQELVRQTTADYVALSGWLKLVQGLNPKTTFNIHPGPLPRFGGKGMYGHHVHEAVIAAYKRDEIKCTEVCMHFVTGEYDQGPVIFRRLIRIIPNDTPETLAKRVNAWEHLDQPWITGMVTSGFIHWDGKNPKSLQLPPSYAIDHVDEESD